MATLWVHIDPTSGRPLALSEEFLANYGEAARGQTVSARHELGAPDQVDVGTVERRSWPLRVVDFDTFGHMNNAAYWAVVEEYRRLHPVDEPLRTSIEYGAGIGPTDAVEIAWGVDGRGRQLLWWEVDGQPAASASVAAFDVDEANTAPR